jgi:hypothetical protein
MQGYGEFEMTPDQLRASKEWVAGFVEELEASGETTAPCGHVQRPPTQLEWEGCPEIIVRECACGRALAWTTDRWVFV